MFHEVVQVIKLVKYNRKSHEMISVTFKCIPTTVNKETLHTQSLTIPNTFSHIDENQES